MIRKRYLILLTVIVTGWCIIFIVRSAINIDAFGIKTAYLLQSHRHKNNHNGRGTINTEGCTIPELDPLDASIISFVEYPDLPQCRNATLALLGNNKTTIWVKYEEDIIDYYNITADDRVSCCYRSFYRPNSIEDITIVRDVDNRVQYDDCVVFNDFIEVKHEFVRVNCSVGNFTTRPLYEQFYLFAPLKTFHKHGKKSELKNDTAYNVLIIGIDSVSRLNFLRTMPKTAIYLNKTGAIKMLGYNKVGFNTFPNLVPMLIGIRDTELKKLCNPHKWAYFDNCPFVWEWFKQAGYYTALVEDSASISTFNYIKPGFAVTPTDYYTRTLFYEAIQSVETESGLCMNDIYYYKVILNYIEDITERLKYRRLFGLFWETSITHDHLNYAMKMDDDYVKMFTNLEESGYLNETIIFFVSDHGIRWGSIRYTKQGRLEESLPFLYLLIPPSFQKEYKKAYNNLRLNSGRLTTPFDVHETLSDLIDLTNVNDSAILIRESQSYASKRGISLFLSVPSNRTCRMADIDDQWCTCRKEVSLAQHHPKVVEAANVLIKMINLKLIEYQQCAKLKLTEILDGTEIRVGEVGDGEDTWTEYMVTVRTDPSRAVFEAVFRYNFKDSSWRLKGAPSRLDRYDDQSECIQDYELRNICYCI